MEYMHLGRTGLRVSRLCMGAMTFGNESDETESHQVLDHFAEAGGTFIDTSNSYTSGVSEEFLGRWLEKKTRHEFVIATKVRFRNGQGPHDRGLSRKHILDSVEGSLRRLKTDYIDLYQIHMWDYSTPLEETLSTLDGLVRSGKVRYLGISNVSGWQLQKAIEMCRQMRWETLVCLQPLYNLLDRETEWELIPVCLNEGLGVIPWSPLRGGWLSGKFRRGMTPPTEGNRVKKTDEAPAWVWLEAWDNYNNETTWTIIDELVAVAQESDKTPAQVAVNWLLQRPGVTAPIIGARTVAQIKDNLGAVGWSLSAEHMTRLNKVSQKPMPYPYQLLQDLVGV